MSAWRTPRVGEGAEAPPTDATPGVVRRPRPRPGPVPRPRRTPAAAVSPTATTSTVRPGRRCSSTIACASGARAPAERRGARHPRRRRGPALHRWRRSPRRRRSAGGRCGAQGAGAAPPAARGARATSSRTRAGGHRRPAARQRGPRARVRRARRRRTSLVADRVVPPFAHRGRRGHSGLIPSHETRWHPDPQGQNDDDPRPRWSRVVGAAGAGGPAGGRPELLVDQARRGRCPAPGPRLAASRPPGAAARGRVEEQVVDPRGRRRPRRAGAADPEALLVAELGQPATSSPSPATRSAPCGPCRSGR